MIHVLLQRFASMSVILFLAVPAYGDGGLIRAAETIGNYRVTVFTTPTPLRVGPVDFSVLVQDAKKNGPLMNVDVQICLSSIENSMPDMCWTATSEAATNKLYHAAKFELPRAGRWRVMVEIDGVHGPGQIQFPIEIEKPLPRWTQMWVWIAWPVIPILLFVLLKVRLPNCVASA